MDWAYRFRDPETLYLNVTNRCTNRCTFCVRARTPRLGDGLLAGGPEPKLDELLAAVDARGGAASFREIVWCGYGEPTLRLDLILAASPRFREAGATVRLNTNGHACLIHGRDVLPELGRVVDRVNVSLNAPSEARYVELCRPDPSVASGVEPPPAPGAFWHAMLDFLARAPSHIGHVQASVVGGTLDPAEIERCRELAAELAGAPLRVR
ncbi:MAG TPA: TatD family nuclease-associated radical SAM protein [Candidatus Sulfomarinibacteraceae bacterium]|nr:TatD family nuclease-associated radical SAM protein [Candidatus Sulfomarinibacteraceae bacterium]